MHSTCSKSGCKIEGSKPTMILPAAALLKTKKTCAQKRKLPLDDDDSKSDQCDNKDEFVSSDDSDVDMESDEKNQDPLERVTKQSIASWKSVSPPVPAEEIQGKWFAVARY